MLAQRLRGGKCVWETVSHPVWFKQRVVVRVRYIPQGHRMEGGKAVLHLEA